MKQSRTLLHNGIELIHYFLPATDSVTVSIMIRAGSADESKDLEGMAHFLEHMIFEGSKKYPDVEKTHLLLEGLGIIENAWTYKNMTNYWMKMPIDNFDKGVKILFDRVFSPLFPLESVEKERGIILEEIKMGCDEPRTNTWNNLSKNIFKGTQLAHKTIGNEKTVSAFTQKQIKHFHRKYYSKGYVTVWVGGNISKDKVIQVLQDIKIPDSDKKVKSSQEKNLAQKSVCFSKMDINMYYVFLGLRGFDIQNNDLEYVLVGNTLLGNGLGSLLNTELKINTPLVSDVGSELEVFADDGILMPYFITTKENVRKALSVTLQQVQKVIDGDFTQDQLTRAVNLVLSDLESLQEISEGFGLTSSLYNLMRRELLSGKKVEYAKVVDKTRKITKEDLVKTFKDILKDSTMVVSISGPDVTIAEKLKTDLQKTSLT